MTDVLDADVAAFLTDPSIIVLADTGRWVACVQRSYPNAVLVHRYGWGPSRWMRWGVGHVVSLHLEMSHHAKSDNDALTWSVETDVSDSGVTDTEMLGLGEALTLIDAFLPAWIDAHDPATLDTTEWSDAERMQWMLWCAERNP